jgi:hypothetical protein
VSAGTEVEVYRHAPHGWCAIRPLETSYSWVSGRYLKVRKDGLATVVADRVPSRIGSQSGAIGDAVQVRLQRGELVELLGTQQIRDGAGTTTWYKIAPPSGEFRWIHSKYIEPETADEGTRGTALRSSPPSRRRLSQAASVSGRGGEQAEGGSEANAGAMDRPAAPRPLPWVYERREPSAAEGEPTQSSGPSRESRRSPLLSGESSSATAEARLPLSPEAYRAEIDDINAQFATILAEAPSRWRCDALARRIDALAARAQTAAQRGQARSLADRLAEARDVQRRYEAPGTGRESRPSAEVNRVREIANRERGRYDGVGRLQPVASHRLGVPSYALTDEGGEVRYYVNAAPGLNMRPYVGHEIAINGIRDLADPNAPIITAKHVTVLDDQRFR